MPTIQDAYDNACDYMDPTAKPQGGSVVLAIAPDSAFGRMATRVGQIWDDESTEELWLTKTHIVQRALFGAKGVPNDLWQIQGRNSGLDVVSSNPFGFYVGAAALAAVDNLITAMEAEGAFVLPEPAHSEAEIYSIFGTLLDQVPSDRFEQALREAEQPIFFANETQPPLVPTKLEAHCTGGDLTDHGKNFELILLIANLVGGTGLACRRAADPSAAGSCPRFQQATAMVYGYALSLANLSHNNASSFQDSDAVAALVRAYAHAPREAMLDVASIIDLKSNLAFVVDYNKSLKPLKVVQQHGRMEIVLTRSSNLNEIIKFAPKADLLSSIARVAAAVGGVGGPEINDCAALSLLESELEALGGGVVSSGGASGRGPRSFASILEELKAYAEARQSGSASGSASAASEGQGEGHALSSTPSGMALQLAIRRSLNLQAVTSAVAKINALVDAPLKDKELKVLQAIMSANNPLLLSLLLNNTPKALVNMRPELSGVHSTRLHLGRAFGEAIKMAAGSTSSANCMSYTISYYEVAQMAKGHIVLSALCEQFSKAFACEAGDAVVTQKSFEDWLTQPGLLDYFTQYVECGFRTIGINPQPFMYILHQCRAALPLATSGINSQGHVISQLTQALDLDLAAFKSTRQADFENYAPEFQDMVFRETAAAIERLQSARKTLATLAASMPQVMEGLKRFGGGAGGGGAIASVDEAAAKRQKVEQTRNMARDELDGLPRYRDDANVSVKGDLLLAFSQRKVTAYSKRVIPAYFAKLKGEGVNTDGKVPRLDALLSRNSTPDERAKEAKNLKPSHIVKEPAGWDHDRAKYVESDFALPPRK